MRSKQRKRLALSTAGIGAIAGALGQMDAIAADDAARHPNPGVEVRTSSTNDVGCIKTIVARPDAHGRSDSKSFLFTYPQGLDIESLSDEQLRRCGLPIRRGFRNLPATSPRYQAWLAESRDIMRARQLTTWDTPQFPPGRIPPPPGPPYESSGGPPSPPLPLAGIIPAHSPSLLLSFGVLTKKTWYNWPS
jgi:hypothetical protein